MDKSKKREYMDKYFQIACDHMDPEDFIDSWWMHLARTKTWYSSSTGKSVKFADMNSTYLYNIKNIVLGLQEDKKEIPDGAAKLISILDFLLMKKSQESEEKEEDYPF